MSPSWSTPQRLGLFYGLMFLVTGASLPYLPVWLRSRGFDGAAIGVILAAPLLARLATGQIVARWADRFAHRRTALLLLAGISAAAYGALLVVQGVGAIAAAWFVGSTAASALLPLSDVLSMRLSVREGFVYGRLRAFGSGVFIVANLTVGALLTRGSPDLVVVWMAAAGVAATVGARLLLPAEPVHEAGAVGPAADRPLRTLLGDRLFLLAIVSSGLILAAHAFQYGFSALVWRRQGVDAAATGALWGTGVAAEIVFLWWLGPWSRRLGPERLLLLAGAASALRWTACAFAPPLIVLFPLQTLHALTFAAAFLGALQLVHRLAPPECASAAQTLNASLSSGLLLGLATLASGPMFDAWGARGYLAMSGMAAAGFAGALVLRRALAVPAPSPTAQGPEAR